MDSHSPTSLRMFIPSSAPSPQSYGHFTFECSIAEHGRGRNKPVPRSGHRIVADDANLYSFGGYNPYSNSTDYGLFPEIWKYNFATRKWTMLSNSGPPEAASHSMILVGDFVLVWGGTGYPWGHCLSNTLHAFSLVQRKWNVLPCTGDVPSHRYGQSMTFKDGHLYVIGGTTGNHYNINIHTLDLKTLAWRNVLPEAGRDDVLPSPRYRHEVAIRDDWLYILGGGAGDCMFDFIEIPVFHTKTKNWMKMKSQPCVTTSYYPPKRKFHAAVQFENFAYICGGHTGGEVLDDIWRLDLRSLQWSRMRQLLPVPLYFHAATATPSGCLYVFGGVMPHPGEHRSNKVFKLWLTIPPLREMVWDTLVTKYGKILSKRRNEFLLNLRAHGYVIPSQLSARMQ